MRQLSINSKTIMHTLKTATQRRLQTFAASYKTKQNNITLDFRVGNNPEEAIYFLLFIIFLL
jgi:hypothetical protein